MYSLQNPSIYVSLFNPLFQWCSPVLLLPSIFCPHSCTLEPSFIIAGLHFSCSSPSSFPLSLHLSVPLECCLQRLPSLIIMAAILTEHFHVPDTPLTAKHGLHHLLFSITLDCIFLLPSSPCYGWRQQSLEKLHNLPKNTQLRDTDMGFECSRLVP